MTDTALDTARQAILEDLAARFMSKAGTPVIPANSCRCYRPQANYLSGQGAIECPVCKTGVLKYLRSHCNCHVQARCSSEGCVQWME